MLALTTGSSSRVSPAPSEITITAARSRVTWAAPSTTAVRSSPSDTSTTPGAPPSSAVTAAMMHAAVAPAVVTAATPRATTASETTLAAPGATNTRATSARARASATIGATLLGSVNVRERASARERLEHRSHPLERRLQIRLRAGVRKAQIPLAMRAERGAGQRGHAGLVQQPLRNLCRRAPRAGDVRKHVERAARPQALHARQLVEAVDEQIAPPLELRHHAPGLFALQRRDPRELHERRRARCGIHHQPRDVLDERLR